MKPEAKHGERLSGVGVPEYTIGGKTKYHFTLIEQVKSPSQLGWMAKVWLADTDEERWVPYLDLRKWPKGRKRKDKK
ncbi:hypothetical protein D8911_09015 [Levilactobacillus brevis]|nr:hypothetical protein D8911_09015 [Levilactobacillus brevis]